MKNCLLLFIISLFAFRSQGQTLIADIPFNSGSTEVQGATFTGTVVNAVPSKDRLGNENSSYSFNGSSSYIDFGSNSIFDLRDGYSISVWFNATGNTGQSIISRGFSGDGDYSIDIEPTDNKYKISFFLEGDNYFNSEAALVSSGWNHLALTLQNQPGGVKLYLNGVLAASSDPLTDLVGSSVNNFFVGTDPTFLPYYFSGAIDDIKIYDGVISGSDVAELASVAPISFGDSKPGFGNALRFDGVDDYAILPSTATDGLTDLTFETWINWEGGEDEQIIWSYGAAGNELVLLQIQSGFPAIKIGLPPTDDFADLSSTQRLQENKWHHLAISFDDFSKNAFIYLDGAEVANAVLSKSPSDIGSLYQTLGLDRVLFPDKRFRGSLDETRLWSSRRSGNAIRKYKNIAIDQYTPDLVYNYNYDESIAFGDNRGSNTLEDLYSNNDGTLIGFDLIGSNSNYISSSAGSGNVQIRRFDKDFVQAGQKLVINGSGFLAGRDLNDVFLGEESMSVLSAAEGRIEIEIPEAFDQIGVLPLQVVNDNGSSHPKLLTVLYKDNNYDYKLSPEIISGNIINSLDVTSGDLDGDGDLDILKGYMSISWLENLGNNNFEQREVIKDNCECQDLKLFDIDNDGDLDVLLAQGKNPNDRKVSWVENLSNGSFSNTPIDVTANGINLREIEVIDSNQDGFNDVLVSSNEGLHVYINDGSNSSFSKTAIKVGPGLLGTGVAVLDLDNDGDMDIFASMYDGAESKYFVFSQDAPGSYVEEYTILESNFGEPIKFEVADFNGDGFDDLVSLNFASSYLFLNNQGDKTFTKSNLKGGLWSGSATDIEGDGDMDLITGNKFGNEVGLYTNDGLGNLTYSVLDNSFYGGIIPVHAADFDNDGDADFIADKSQEGIIELYSHINIGNDLDSLAVDGQVEEYRFDQSARQIDITVPHEYSLEQVVPSFQTTFRSKAYVDGVLQESGASVVDFTDTVTYEVIGEDGNGKLWNVTLNPLPGIPEITEIDDFTQTAAEIEWSIPDFTDAVILQLSVDEFETLVLDTTLFREEIVVDFLTAGTQYAARVKGINDFGESESFSDELFFITIPPNPILIDSIVSTSTTAVISWQENKATDNYILDIARDSTFTEFANGFDGRSLNTLSETVFGLTPGTKYWVRLSATNTETLENGASGFSDVLTFTTALDAAPVAKEETGLTLTAFTANWDLIAGQNISYVVEVSDDEQFTNIVRTQTVNFATSLEISDLPSGMSHWYRVYGTNANGRSPYSNTIFVEQPIQLAEIQYPSEKSRSNVEPISLNFEVKGGQDPYEITFRYRGILTNEWVEDSVQLLDGIYQYTIENDQFDDVGIEFEVIVTDGFKTVRRSGNFIYWNDAESELTSLDLVNEWQIFSIPYILSDNLIETIFDEMGPFDYNSQWRLVRFDGERYLDAGAGINRIEMGASYWFNTTEEVRIQIENASVNRADVFSLPLNQGWNQIGNPYNVPISWNKVRISNRVTTSVDQVNVYNMQSKQFVEGDIIEAFGGGFVWSDIAQQVDISLRADNASARQLLEEEKLGEDIDAEQWLFELLLTNSGGDTLSSPVGIGVHPLAENGKDEFDKMRLPRFMKYTDMASRHESYFYPYFSRDIQRNANQGSWLFELASNQTQETISLTWQNDQLQGATRQLWLIDEDNGLLINLADQNSLEIRLRDQHKLSLHYTSSRSERPLPFTIQMGNPYPNPTSEWSTVEVLLPKAERPYDLMLELIDLKGKLVSTLAQGTYEAGVYKFKTDIRKLDPFNGSVYFYRLTVNGENKVKRIIVQR